MPEPHKDLLESGMRLILRSGNYRYVLLETRTLHNSDGIIIDRMNNYTEHLFSLEDDADDVMEVWQGDIQIAKREEKSELDILVETIEGNIEELKKELAKLKNSEN